MVGFLTPVDIANRGLQHCGVELISDTDGFNETSDRAQQTGFCYDKLRRAELRRNYWQFAIKHAVVRPVVFPGTQDGSGNPLQPTLFMTPTLWSSTTTYFLGSIVSDAMGSRWVSKVADNLNNDPAGSLYWDAYYGPTGVTPYDTTGTTAYFMGDVVYVTTGNGAFVTYMSRKNSNTSVPGTVDAFSATAIYMKDALVSYSSVTYQSLFDVNVGNTPSATTAPAVWAALTTYSSGNRVRGSDGYMYLSAVSSNLGNDPVSDDGTHWTNTGVLASWTSTLTRTASADEWLVLGVVLSQIPLLMPLGVAPQVQGYLRSVYPLPANFLCMAPQDPKAGANSYLGAPSGETYRDWVLDGKFLITRTVQPIVLRFVADVTNVPDMDDMFCEGLGARIGYEVAPKLTQSVSKRDNIAQAYKTFMGEARLRNGIEQGPTEPPEDDYIAARA